MIQQVTKGIRVSVETRYEGSFLKNSISHHSFRYLITIENQSKETVQLIKRHWIIKKSCKHPQIVEGPGVVGKKPIIKSGQVVQYESGCILNSTTGSMKGYYTMINHSSANEFRLEIPVFQLEAPFSLN
ncbi:MAG: Co2+/Mg2+ efflux protein ApaG [Flavobacteriales bacterium]|nr:Co2+/Mg2+ efflux protein ApaG [Candidatus Arcticimaribacter sp.]|tara:strand:+ start:1640 stop:2026 length:387 start_codon:yes stop_codon:yes gene_type:complete